MSTENERFTAYLDGSMPDDEQTAFESELADDHELGERFEAFSRPADVPEGAAAEPDVRASVQRRIRRRSGGKFFSEGASPQTFVTLGLVVVLIGLIVVLFAGPESFVSGLMRPDVESLPGESTEGSEAPDDAPSEAGAASEVESSARAERFEGGAVAPRDGARPGERRARDPHYATPSAITFEYVLTFSSADDATRADIRSLTARLTEAAAETSSAAGEEPAQGSAGEQTWAFHGPVADVRGIIARLSELGPTIERRSREVSLEGLNDGYLVVVGPGMGTVTGD